MKEDSIKSLKIALNFMEPKNKSFENQIVCSIGSECYNSKKALFFIVCQKVV